MALSHNCTYVQYRRDSRIAASHPYNPRGAGRQQPTPPVTPMATRIDMSVTECYLNLVTGPSQLTSMTKSLATSHDINQKEKDMCKSNIAMDKLRICKSRRM